jgi:16S rRNA (cytidine1402-2'-O)-methyltransferase
VSIPSATPGRLSLVATPLGNLEDITERALRTLREADLIAAEDTRRTLGLLMHFGIQPKRLESCFEHNEKAKVAMILRALGEGKSVALVTDAGMPGISDPGAEVVRAAVEAGFVVTPVSGGTAMASALAASGLPTAKFRFEGFLPSKGGDRRKTLQALKSEEITLVFYEAPHRLSDCLKDMLGVFGARRAVVAREMSKIHEEFVRGSLQELSDRYHDAEILGEITLLVEGAEKVDRSGVERWVGVSIEEQLVMMMRDQGLSKTEAVKAVAKMRDLPRDVVYEIAKDLKYSKDGVGNKG